MSFSPGSIHMPAILKLGYVGDDFKNPAQGYSSSTALGSFAIKLNGCFKLFYDS
jgi:hypothetical protein